MIELHLETQDGRQVYPPGAVVEGQASWQGDEAPKWVEVRLFWYTVGKGTRDVGLAASQRWEPAGPTGRERFALQLPPGPQSYAGKLVSIEWALELVAGGSDAVQRVELVVTPASEDLYATGGYGGTA